MRRSWGWAGRHKAERQWSVVSGTAAAGDQRGRGRGVVAGLGGQAQGLPLPEIEGDDGEAARAACVRGQGHGPAEVCGGWRRGGRGRREGEGRPCVSGSLPEN